MLEMCKTRTMRFINGNGNWLFFEESGDKIYFSLVSRNGDLIRKGEMRISQNAFIEAMEAIGFEYVRAGDLL